jgi:hypothetical protein
VQLVTLVLGGKIWERRIWSKVALFSTAQTLFSKAVRDVTHESSFILFLFIDVRVWSRHMRVHLTRIQPYSFELAISNLERLAYAEPVKYWIRDEAPKLNTEDVIMCCLIRAIPQLRGCNRWVWSNGKTMIGKGNPKYSKKFPAAVPLCPPQSHMTSPFSPRWETNT